MVRTLTQSDVTNFRERLCEVATRLFEMRGAEGLTLREIASELGVSAMSIYCYFKDKDEILAAMRARALNRLSDALETARLTKRTATEKDNNMLRAYVAFALGESAAYKLTFDMTQPDEDLYPDLAHANRRARATMADYVRQHIDEGTLVGDPALIAQVFWSALHGSIALKLSKKLSAKFDIERISQEIFDVVFDAYRPKTA